MLTVTGGQQGEPWQLSPVSQCVSGCRQGQGVSGHQAGGEDKERVRDGGDI